MKAEQTESDEIDNDAARSADDSHLKDRRSRSKTGGKDSGFCPRLRAVTCDLHALLILSHVEMPDT